MSEESILTVIGNKLLHMKGICPRTLANLNIESQLESLNLSYSQYRLLMEEIEEKFEIKFCKAFYLVPRASIGLLIASIKEKMETKTEFEIQ